MESRPQRLQSQSLLSGDVEKQPGIKYNTEIELSNPWVSVETSLQVISLQPPASRFHAATK